MYVRDKYIKPNITDCLFLVKRCKEKWKNIRTVFRRHHFAEPVSEGDDSSKKEYYMTDALQFLVPTLRGNPKPLSSQYIISEHIIGENYNNQLTIPDEEDNATTEFPEIPKCILNSSIGSSTSSIEGLRKPQLGKRKANSSLDDNMINYFKSKAKPVENRTNTDVEDPEAQSDEHFLLSLKEDMKEMNARQKRTFKKRIFDLIDEVLDDK